MAEPTTTGGATWSLASWLAVFFSVQLPFIDPHTLIGAVGGGLVYLVFDQTVATWKRFIGSLISVVMGYIWEPEIMARTGLQTNGIGAFVVSSLLIVLILLVMSMIRDRSIISIFSRGKS